MNGDQQSSPTPPSRPRILWGRVASYGLSLVLVFALGAWSGGDDTADAELAEARAEVERLAQENVNLRAENEALQAGGALDAGEASAPDGEDPEEPGDAEANGIGADQADPDESAEESEPPTEDGDDDAAGAAELDEAPDAADPGSSTYVVREGDTGMSIAEEVYGDEDLWPRIAEANDLGGANALQVDQELVIPPSE